jgi:hypothetical protein
MHPVRRRPLAAVAAPGVAATVAGCGGGGPDRLGAAEFRERADAVCADADDRFEALTRPVAGAEFLPFLRAALPIGDEELQRLGELEPPEDMEAAFDEARGRIAQSQERIAQAAERIEAGEEPEVVIGEVGPLVERLQVAARAKAAELGLTVCAAQEGEPAGTAGAGTAGPAAPEAPTAPTAPRTGGDDKEAYVADVREAAGALRSFGSLLQGTTSLDDLRSKVPDARAQLEGFDAAIARLDDYSFDNATLERQRSGLAETGPRVGDVLRRFVDTANTGDTEAVQALVPEVTQAITDFQEAATTTPEPKG